MTGAPRELQHVFGLDKKEAREIFRLWTEELVPQFIANGGKVR